MSNIKSVCVFCGSRMGNHSGFATEAEMLGKALAQNNFKIVYGGGQVGLMGIMAKAALAHRGYVTGVIPTFLNRQEVKFDEINEIIETKTLRDRIKIMSDEAQAFIVLPGGVGTLDELMQMFTMNILREHDKPLILIDYNGFWQAFMHLLEAMSDSGFMYSGVKEKLILVADATAAILELKRRNNQA